MALLTARKVGLAVLLYALFRRTALYRALRRQFGERLRDQFGRLLLSVPAAQAGLGEESNKSLVDFRAKLVAKWAKEFGEPLRAIPEHGWSPSQVKALVDNVAHSTHKACSKTHMSGAIYSYSLVGAGSSAAGSFASDAPPPPGGRPMRTPEDFLALSSDLKDVFSHTFGKAYLWNSLHSTEFGVGDWLSYQVVRMVADMFGGKPDEVMGLITTGGTGSLMTAMRAYRDWGRAARSHAVGEGVILCSYSIHAAVLKAGEAYDIQVEVLPMLNASHSVDLAAARAAVKRLGPKLLCVIGSTPSYALGTIDPIEELAAMAKAAGVGMHVDSCLGGFVVNYLEHVNPNFLAIDGVTSLSCDTHKNGWAPKGSSVLVTKKMPGRDPAYGGDLNLAFYSAYAIPGWSGGIYGTPQDPGSMHVTHVLHAFCAMLIIGKSGYRQIARAIHRTTVGIAEAIKEHPVLELLHEDRPDGLPVCNVVGWRLSKDAAAKWGAGGIFCLAHEMETQHVTVSAVAGHALHFCVTGRSAAQPEFLATFRRALRHAVLATEAAAAKVVAGEAQFPGDAGLYGTLEAAMEPTAANSKGLGDLAQNWLLGNKGAKDGVRTFFYAIHDPYASTVYGERS